MTSKSEYRKQFFLLPNGGKLRGLLVCYESHGGKWFVLTQDSSIKKDDYVIVPTAQNRGNEEGDQKVGAPFTVARVVEADVEPDFDNTVEEVRWVAGKFDPTVFYQLCQTEQGWIGHLKDAEKTRRRKDMADKLQFHHDEKLAQISFDGDASETLTEDESSN